MIHEKVCIIPKRSILTREDLEKFQESPAFHKFTVFLEKLSESVKGKTLRAPTQKSDVIIALQLILQTIKSWIADIDAAPEGKSRFGLVL
jgi:serine/threonine-protein phosphatase 2A activator